MRNNNCFYTWFLEKLGRNQLTLINSFHISFFFQIKELNSFPKLTKLANPRTLPNMMTHNQIERMLAPINPKVWLKKSSKWPLTRQSKKTLPKASASSNQISWQSRRQNGHSCWTKQRRLAISEQMPAVSIRTPHKVSEQMPASAFAPHIKLRIHLSYY